MESKKPADMAPSDAELVTAALDGRPRAFDLLIERHQRRAVGLAYRMLGNLQDALEATQEAFIRAHRSLDTLEDPERFGPWFLRIVTNQSLNYRRSRAARPRVSFEDCIIGDDRSAAETFAAPAHADVHPEAHAAAAELAERVQHELAALPDQQRLALVLFSIEQLPQKEVAAIMGCSVEAVKWHVFQARKKLRERLADHL